MAIISALPMMLVMWLSSVILVWTGQDPAVVEAAKPLFHAFVLVMLPMNMMFVIEQFLVGINKTRLVMLMSVFQVPLSIFFYYVFIFGNWGFPKLGLVGIAWGLALADTVIAILLILYLKFSQQFSNYHLFNKWWVVNKKFLSEMFRIGIPLGFVYCIEVALFAAVAIMMGALSVTTLAAYQIAYQFWTIPLCVTFALSQTVTIRVGHEVGRNNRDALKLAAIVNSGFSLLVVLLFSIFYINFAQLAIGLDIDVNATHLQAIAKEAVIFLPIVGIVILIDCFRLVIFGALRGMKDTKFPLVVSIVGFWCIAFPVAYLLAFKFKLGGIGIWWGIGLGILVAGVMLLIRFYRLVKRIDLEALVTRS
jgi:MATE family multidrug resistance protein